MRLHLSPCPNDTFAFHALIHGLVGGGGYQPFFDDIDALNRAALGEGEQLVKVSYALLPRVADRYRLLRSGGALGRGNGPVLVSRRPLAEADLAGATVAIPGIDTTANALLSRLFPEVDAVRKQPMLFSEIAEAVVRGEVDAGVLIHEGRFTYAERGLRLVADLGERWEESTGLPIPLGAILIHRSVPLEEARRVSDEVRQSVAYALEHPEASAEFVRLHAQELSPAVRRQHIDCFVNAHSLDLDEQARRAVERLTGLEQIEYV